MVESVALKLAQDLIRRKSISPEDGGCQQVIANRLKSIGFDVTFLPFADVTNLWATCGHGSPVFVFAGHTDVVPAGNTADWISDPFEPTLRDGYLYGRGAADMKGSLAAMIVAIERFQAHTKFPGTLGVLLTSDEEADATHGTVKVIEHLQSMGINIDQCVIGEPSSDKRTGDTMRVGRRGSLHGKLILNGTSGHVAYPHLADNPIHRLPDVISKLTNMNWDNGNTYFPATSLQISNIHAGDGTTNVIPGTVEIVFNFRFCTESTTDSLIKTTQQILDSTGLDHDLFWQISGQPFLTTQGNLIPVACEAVSDIVGYQPELSTSGGTSDGRFIAPSGSEVIELGPSNLTIHKNNECISVVELDLLSEIYERILILRSAASS